ncbi:MAG: cell envelope integrity protein CreD [Candidatus Marinimicrobia bacterium]|jgi:inner membrane protein|nr:cell envelope integrity protein CreD [Candidatus Neomarinimicrobiota bacterium]MBT3634308.1 cell envelope integrity protein CreD [Candidatus Neomarinimicrobiota bacterium]MBT3682893.1 cell envelope integrity protein CreD [Candidatus Neomarinimicrobiota bacterium]MBT3760117.1 cell envelope integrity protein CreD [Candidatus Neomarinimicrobiota bacterium]MBT3896116.1 cell envelope integrity protein CreD [Candidatus Neomarinimicrobiota bacterium]
MKKNWMKYSISARLIIIGLLVLILLIPSFMIQSLISERQSRRDAAVAEVNEKWGQTQTITGPILSIPFTTYIILDEGKTSSKIMYAHVLPDKLNISGTILPEIRNRGIYDVVLYNSQLLIEGSIIIPALDDLKINPDEVIWKDAFISVGITDMKGIKELVTFEIDSNDYLANSGIETNNVVESGVSKIIDGIKAKREFTFSFKLDINGSGGLKFTPTGKETNVSISSNWINPSFMGRFLPNEHDITAEGFSANWQVLHLNRNFPQKWIGSRYKVENYSFGVDLIVPVNEYQKNMRTVKYAFMFIGLTFLSFFMIELLNKKVMHPIQYLLIGFSLLVFYALLLSISEHILFKYAYLISCLATILLISTYTISVLRSKLQTGIIFTILVLLYIYLYILIQLQDFALLVGATGLFVILSLVMYLTRKIDWFSMLDIKEIENENQI